MNRRAIRNGLIATIPLWITIALAIIYWRYIILALLGLFAWRVIAQQAGIRHGRRSSFAANVKALAIAYAAWNSRWLKPSVVKVRTGKAKGAWPDRNAPAGVGLSEDFPDGY